MLKRLFWQLYPKTSANRALLDEFMRALPSPRPKPHCPLDQLVVYALYVDQFAKDFRRLSRRLGHITGLGCNAVWLLPILESPGLDQGFDISDYYRVRRDLGGNAAFFKFLKLAKSQRLKVIFDVSINHTSIRHPWFRNRPDFYIWSKNRRLYTNPPNRVIFPHDPADPQLDRQDPRQKWVWDRRRRQYYYRTFYRHQPDLNYRNPEVLLAMSRVLVFWAQQGVAGFRADAAPFLWKEKGRVNESLPQTHLILRFFKAAVSRVNPAAFLVAEACQKPQRLFFYLHPDECRLAYHFPRMVSLWQAIINQDFRPLINDLKATPKLKPGCHWLTFLRLHDELSLEMAPESIRRQLYPKLIKNGLDFRAGGGVSGRLASFLDNNPQKILFAWELLLSLPGLPLIFMGDAEGQTNNFDYYRHMKQTTGQDDTRLINRGPFNWDKINWEIYHGLKRLLRLRRQGRLTLSRAKIPPAKVDMTSKKFFDAGPRRFELPSNQRRLYRPRPSSRFV